MRGCIRDVFICQIDRTLLWLQSCCCATGLVNWEPFSWCVLILAAAVRMEYPTMTHPVHPGYYQTLDLSMRPMTQGHMSYPPPGKCCAWLRFVPGAECWLFLHRTSLNKQHLIQKLKLGVHRKYWGIWPTMFLGNKTGKRRLNGLPANLIWMSH